MASNAEKVSNWWRHHVICRYMYSIVCNFCSRCYGRCIYIYWSSPFYDLRLWPYAFIYILYINSKMISQIKAPFWSWIYFLCNHFTITYKCKIKQIFFHQYIFANVIRYMYRSFKREIWILTRPLFSWYKQMWMLIVTRFILQPFNAMCVLYWPILISTHKCISNI